MTSPLPAAAILLPMTTLIQTEIQEIDLEIAALQTRRRNAQTCLNVALGNEEELAWVVR